MASAGWYTKGRQVSENRATAERTPASSAGHQQRSYERKQRRKQQAATEYQPRHPYSSGQRLSPSLSSATEFM
jgi:hypothetical protein